MHHFRQCRYYCQKKITLFPVVIGRKNWLFAHCERGADANAVLYSIIETAKENMLKPYEYIKWVLESLKNMSFESFEDFLPWGNKIPLEIRLEC